MDTPHDTEQGENKRLREALKLARADLLTAVEQIDRELRYKEAAPVSNGDGK